MQHYLFAHFREISTPEGEPISIRYEKQPIEVTVQQQKGWRLTQITKKGTDSN